MQPAQFQQQLVTTTSLPPPADPWMTTTPPRPSTLPSYQRHQSVYLGLVLIVVGILSIAFNIIDLCINRNVFKFGLTLYSHSEVGHGLWSGLSCIISGGFGIAAGKRRSLWLIRSFVVMSSLAACTSLAQLIVAVSGAHSVHTDITDNYLICCTGTCRYYDYYDYYRYTPNKVCNEIRTLIAMESFLAVMGFIGGVAAIWGSALGCRVARAAGCCTCCCCKDSFQRPQQFTIVNIPNSGIQMAIITQNGGQQLIPVQYPMQFPIQYPVNFAPPPYSGPVAGGYMQPGFQFTAVPPCYPPPSTALVSSSQLPLPAAISQTSQPLIPSSPAPPPVYNNC